MDIIFQYSKEKDVWCILSKGKSSNNSPTPTKIYELLVSQYGENPTPEMVDMFVDKYISENNINIPKSLETYQEDWRTVSSEYKKRAESIFHVSLPDNITAFLTINNRCPYSIEENNFFVSLQNESVRRTVMHELWHFYTWYRFGDDQVKKIGAQKYNDLKEALTVLLNIECNDLLPSMVQDIGYPQHQGIREGIMEFWKNNRDIKELWNYLVVL